MIRIIVGPDDRPSPETELHKARAVGADFGSSCLVIDSMPVKHYVDIPNSLKSSVSEESLKDIQWYYETYPIHDPFGSSRAEGVVAQLRLQGEEIVRGFFGDDILSPDVHTRDLEIWVKNRQGDVAFRWLDLLCWELLEDLSLWQTVQNAVLRRVKVIRIFEASSPISDHLPVPDADGKRILAITARPALNDDVPHRLITRAILRAVQKYSSANPHASHALEIVRPGTLAALVARLESGDVFDIVHLDVHGYTDDKGSYVEFVKFNGFETVIDPVSPEDLALTLAKYDVKRVFLNACRSAASSTAQASVAQTLIKHGICSVIGMSYNIGTAAAGIFVESFYLEYLRPNATIIDATSAARNSMRRNKQRATKFDEMIQVQDHIVPILYQSTFSFEKEDLALSSLNLRVKTIEADTVELGIPACIGREIHILDLESYVSRGIPVLLHGQAGIGKTSLLDEVSLWWQSTGLIGGTIYINAPELQASVIEYVRRQVALALTLPLEDFEKSTFSQLAALIKEQKLLFIIDNLESLQPTNEQETLNLMRDIKQLLKPLRNHMVIIASRDVEDWLSSFVPCTYGLEGLDERDALKFGLSLVRELKPQNQELSRDDLRFFSLLLGLVAGVPLAIQLLMRMYKEYINDEPGLSCKKFYLRLLSIDVLNFQSAGSEWARHEKGARCIPKIQDMVENGMRANSYGNKVVSVASAEVMQDVLQLAPFWLYIPYKIEDYWLFLGMAMRRAVEGQEVAQKQTKDESSRKSSDLGPTFWAGAFDDGEWEFMKGPSSSDQATCFRLAEETKASHIWFQRIQEMSALYLISGPVTKTFRGRQGSLTKQYYRVNPVFTLIARSYHRPDISYWHEVILSSFRRFMFSQVSQWASAGPSNWSWIPENDLVREEVQFHFANFAASSRASIWTEGFRGEEWAFKQMRILNVAAADHEPSAWATLAIYDEYLSSTMEFVRQEKQKVTDADGLALIESLFTETTGHAAKIEKYCIVLLADCALFAQTADDASTEFKKQKCELQHLSLSNHPKYSTPEERSWNDLCLRVGQRKANFYENPNEKTLEDCTIIMKEFKEELEKRTSRAAEYWDPALVGTPIGEAFGRISVGGPNSFHERYNALSASLSVYDDEKPVEQKRKEIEQLLQAEISGTNIPLNRWHLYYILAELCRLTGDSKVGRQHQDRYLALEKMIDPYLLRIQKKTMDFWLEYHGTHSWELLDPPEEGDISEVIERLHRDTEASRRRYSTSDLELQDDIFAEAGALEKAERYDEATKLFSELTDDYRFTSRSPISILGPQHHIAILLMQQEKYPEASLKLRKLLSQQLNQEQEAIASIGLAQCLFMQTQKMENPQDAIREQLLNEAEKLTATALQLRENTYPSWHWHYLVPKRLRAQILTTLGSPANIAECRRTMQEIQASIMTDVKDVGNRQRFANINHLANFLLRSREFEEAEKVFEIMYISALLQKGEEDPITMNCERNLVAALRGQGVDCDVRFVRDFQSLKLAYQRWRQTVLRFPADKPVQVAFQRSAEVFLGFLIRHAGNDKGRTDLERFMEEHNALCERLLVLQAREEP